MPAVTKGVQIFKGAVIRRKSFLVKLNHLHSSLSWKQYRIAQRGYRNVESVYPSTLLMSLVQVLAGLQIAVAILILILLYHALFIAVDLRKILRRIDSLTGQVEEVIMKPISMADHIFQWVADYIEEDNKKKKKKSGKVGKKKK